MNEPTQTALIGVVGGILATATPFILRKIPHVTVPIRLLGRAAVGFCVAATTLAVFLILRQSLPDKDEGSYPDEITFSPENQDFWIRFKGCLYTNLNNPEIKKFSHKTIEVNVLRSENYGEQLDNLRKRRVQVYALSAGTTATAVLDPGCHYTPAFELCSAGLDGVRRPIKYHAVLIVNAAVNKEGVTDFSSLIEKLKNNPSYKFGLGQETSHSSYRVPTLALKAFECPDSSLKRTTYNHEHLIECVRNRSEQIVAACVASDVYDRYKPEQKADAVELPWPTRDLPDKAVMYLSHDVPSVSFGWRDDLPNK